MTDMEVVEVDLTDMELEVVEAMEVAPVLEDMEAALPVAAMGVVPVKEVMVAALALVVMAAAVDIALVAVDMVTGTSMILGQKNLFEIYNIK